MCSISGFVGLYVMGLRFKIALVLWNCMYECINHVEVREAVSVSFINYLLPVSNLLHWCGCGGWFIIIHIISFSVTEVLRKCF